jgi:hypothetical protein
VYLLPKVRVPARRGIVRRLPAEQVAKLVVEYNAGVIISDLAKQFKIHTTTVSLHPLREGSGIADGHNEKSPRRGAEDVPATGLNTSDGANGFCRGCLAGSVLVAAGGSAL